MSQLSKSIFASILFCTGILHARCPDIYSAGRTMLADYSSRITVDRFEVQGKANQIMSIYNFEEMTKCSSCR